jgi:hypothetical protein
MTPKPALLPRLALVAMVAVLQMSAPDASGQAAKFDEKLKAPEAPGNQALKTQIREYFDVYARVTAESLSGIVRDRSAFAKWFDTHWLLQRAIDMQRDLGDLSEFGIAPRGDGSYTVDIKNFPQWTPLNTSALRLLEPQLLEAYTPDLKARGFRDQDIDAIKAYTQAHRPDQMARRDKLSLSESFATRVEQRMARGVMLGTKQMLDYLYQNSRIQEEATRAWTVDLLDSLDKQRQRILESCLNDQDRSGTMAIAPDDIDAAAQWMSTAIMSGEHSRLLETEKARLREMEVLK